jgi:SAM-dependent methyltransferase
VSEPADTRGPEYAARLEQLSGARWKRWLDVQAPYRWNLRRLRLGRTLEVGCGVGRNLAHLPPGSVGIDPNPHAVEGACRRGCTALLPEAFRASAHAALPFDALLCAHVLEHMDGSEARELLAGHVGFLRPAARVVLVTPQEAGFRSDPTHVRFLDFDSLRVLLEGAGCDLLRAYSFPFPRAAGRIFPHNEFVVVGVRREGSASRR